LFAFMVGRGMRRAWLAQHLDISRALLWRYEHGYDRMPAQFVERACRIVGIPASLITIPEPRDRFIQQPRQSKSGQSTTTERTEKQDDPRRTADDQQRRNARRTQSTASDAQPVTYHTPRHGAVASGARSRSSRDDASSTSDGRSAADASNGAKRRVARSRRRTGVAERLASAGDL
jgi:transcriptional regulator with XRE-family HTH domain